jgi:predicted dehydrogenase
MAIEIAISGMGFRGRDWVRQVRSCSAYKLTAFIDTDENVLTSAAENLGIPRSQCFTDLQVAIDETRFQALIIATSSDDHVGPCESAISRGLGVMVEKPFTLRLHEAVKLVSLAEEKGVPLLVAQNYRYLRSFRAARQVIADGKLGRVGMVVCQYYRPPHDMAASLARLPHNVLWGVGVHHLDALCYVLNKEIVSLAADDFTLPWSQLSPGGSLRAIFSFAGETRGQYTATYESSGHEFFERGQEFYTRFVGERGTLHVFHRWLVLCESGKLPRLVRRGPRKMTEEQILLRQLAAAIQNGEPAEVSGRNNLKTMAVLEACVRSASDRTWVNPQDLLNESN